jgi:hypothetical protein
LVNSVPTTFLPEYATPCWNANDTLHCLPAFHLLGGFQSAQSQIWSMLRRHPRILNVSARTHPRRSPIPHP